MLKYVYSNCMKASLRVHFGICLWTPSSRVGSRRDHRSACKTISSPVHLKTAVGVTNIVISIVSRFASSKRHFLPHSTWMSTVTLLRVFLWSYDRSSLLYYLHELYVLHSITESLCQNKWRPFTIPRTFMYTTFIRVLLSDFWAKTDPGRILVILHPV